MSLRYGIICMNVRIVSVYDQCITQRKGEWWKGFNARGAKGWFPAARVMPASSADRKAFDAVRVDVVIDGDDRCVCRLSLDYRARRVVRHDACVCMCVLMSCRVCVHSVQVVIWRRYEARIGRQTKRIDDINIDIDNNDIDIITVNDDGIDDDIDDN